MVSAFPAPGLRWLGLRLSAMFFIDIAVSGSYFPLLSLHLSKTLRLSAAEISYVYAVGPLTALESLRPWHVGS